MSRSNTFYETSEGSQSRTGPHVGENQKAVIQRQLPKLIQKIAQEASTNTSWAPALKAAPTAISVMATCLVASSSKVAGAIEVNRTGVVPGGGQIDLPHKYLSTNLQHCSDLGRIAFTDAQNSMHKLRGYADNMTGADGVISNILELLEDEEAAKYDLRSAMEDLQENAHRSKKEAGSIQGKFQLLLDFIMALQNAAIERQNSTQDQQKQNKRKIHRREEERKEHIKKIETYREEVDSVKKQLEEAGDYWRKAKDTVEDLTLASALDAVADIEDDTLMAEPDVRYFAPDESVGGVTKMKHKVFGKSYGRKLEEERARKDAQSDFERRQGIERARHDKKIDRLLEKRQSELEVAKEEAQKKLSEAQTTFDSLQKRLEQAEAKLTTANDKHLQAKLDLDASQADLEALSNEKIELSDILEIIESSIKSLKQMKQYVDDMCVFFTEISTEVENTMDGPMHKFLSKIDNAIVASGNKAGAREIENLRVHQTSKRQLVEAALRLQGKLSIIGDIAGVYVNVSKLYIKPGINKMEGLTFLSSSEYTFRVAEFQEWCRDAVEEIEGFSRKETKVMIDKMAIGVRAMARETLAIESAA